MDSAAKAVIRGGKCNLQPVVLSKQAKLNTIARSSETHITTAARIYRVRCSSSEKEKRKPRRSNSAWNFIFRASRTVYNFDPTKSPSFAATMHCFVFAN